MQKDPQQHPLSHCRLEIYVTSLHVVHTGIHSTYNIFISRSGLIPNVDLDVPVHKDSVQRIPTDMNFTVNFRHSCVLGQGHERDEERKRMFL